MAATTTSFCMEDVGIGFSLTEQVRERETLNETSASKLEREMTG